MIRAVRFARLRLTAIAILLVTVIFLITLLFTRSEQVSNRLLRAGGGIVMAVTERPGRTTAVSGALLLLVWGGIGLRCLVECAGDPNPSNDTV